MKQRVPVRWMLVPAVIAWTVVGAGCGGGTDREDLLALTYMEFDQSPDTGFRPVADNGDYRGAAEMIETYLAGKKGLNGGQIGYLHFHAGQLWAFHGDMRKAVAHMDQATVDSPPPGFPQSFNALVAGTRGFLVGDMEAVRLARDDIGAMTALSARDTMFLEAMELLATKEGVSYYDVTFSTPD